MEEAYYEAQVCSSESRAYVDVEAPWMDQELLKELYKRKPIGNTGKHVEWTAEMDKHLLALWNMQPKDMVAKALGVCPGTARTRYRELTSGK